MHTPETVAKVFKALCDPKRVAIIQYLRAQERCACEMAESLDMAQSKLSYHMKILCDSGIVECWYVGKWSHYRVSPQGGAYAIQLLEELTQ